MHKAIVTYHKEPGGWWAEIVWPLPNGKNRGNTNNLHTRCAKEKTNCKENVKTILNRLELQEMTAKTTIVYEEKSKIGGKMNDTYLECDSCGRKEVVDFGGSLRTGWPECCGYTMRLETTTANIAEATKEAIGPRSED